MGKRALFQVLVFPYRLAPDGELLYGVFKRETATGGYWQGIAGSGQEKESALDAATREALEEAGIKPNSQYIQLDSCAMIPVASVEELRSRRDVLVMPEYSFGVKVESEQLQLSREHSEYKWLRYEDAVGILRWDSNKTALWELEYRLRKRMNKGTIPPTPESLCVVQESFSTESRDGATPSRASVAHCPGL